MNDESAIEKKNLAGVAFEVRRLRPDGYVWESYIGPRLIKTGFSPTRLELYLDMLWHRLVYSTLFGSEIRRAKILSSRRDSAHEKS